jgi:hypothetical protein
VTRHLSIHEKKSRCGGPGGPAPCPYCRQKISSQTLNLSLHKMITNILSLQQTLEKADADKVGFCDGFLQAQTRCNILQNELQDSTRMKEVNALPLPPPCFELNVVIGAYYCQSRTPIFGTMCTLSKSAKLILCSLNLYWYRVEQHGAKHANLELVWILSLIHSICLPVFEEK